MPEAEQLSDLIGAIYDASLDPVLWLPVLEQTSRFINSATATIGSRDMLQKHTSFSKAWGYDTHYLQLLENHYLKINPLNEGAALGDVLSIGEVIPYAQFYASSMYLEWGKPQGYIDAIQATLEKTGTALAFFHAIRHERQGMVDDEMRRRLRLLWPHFRRAVLIGKVVDLHKVHAASLADTLDGIAAGLFLVDAPSRIVHANARGRDILSQNSVLRNDRERLSAIDPQADAALAEVFAAAGNGDAEVGNKGITISLTAGEGERHVAHVLPLTSGKRKQAGMAYAAVAAVFVRKAALDGPSPIEALVSAYKLTPAELRVLLAIVEVGGIPEIAPMLGISEATVKTHLQHVFEKT
jgi:DNA-binding CsgD family transcriptional regulator